jgi:hypothetical protein
MDKCLHRMIGYGNIIIFSNRESLLEDIADNHEYGKRTFCRKRGKRIISFP